ncbi:hypothetical protein GCM10010383_28410 [Streptomyces lomondensis]|uniref:Uncharacterized protein n=1 Tax=Streptomyces lomondensis TaxID=68229 RepID=A0ABQ2X3C3_9ACTN|nr:hypothetical protein GCM10010383_28410 [Streptomyces lomondensis]
MREALGQHRPVPHRDHGDEQERQQAQDLPQAADRDASGESSRAEFGEWYRCHIRRGFPSCANGGLRKRGLRMAYGKRLGLGRGKRLRGERHRGLCAGGRGRWGWGRLRGMPGRLRERLDLKIA